MLSSEWNARANCHATSAASFVSPSGRRSSSGRGVGSGGGGADAGVFLRAEPGDFFGFAADGAAFSIGDFFAAAGFAPPLPGSAFGAFGLLGARLAAAAASSPPPASPAGGAAGVATEAAPRAAAAPPAPCRRALDDLLVAVAQRLVVARVGRAVHPRRRLDDDDSAAGVAVGAFAAAGVFAARTA